MNKIIVICGPTATGKTKLAVDLAKKYNGELVSADSRQVYKGMDIITGKDILNSKFKIQNSKFKLKVQNCTIGHYLIDGVRVWMFDIVEPTYGFNVSEYVTLANKIISDILSRGKLPIVVGGTGFYLRGLFGNIETLGISPNQKLRKQLDNLTVVELQIKLDQLDQLVKSRSFSMNQSDRNNPRRLIRAIEVATWFSCHSGDPPAGGDSGIDSGQARMTKYNVLWLGLSTDLPTLKQRIEKRVADRIKAGAEKEIAELMKLGYTWNNSRLGDTIGYCQWRDYFEGKITREQAIADWTQAEIAYAKRQLTWFRKEKQINWFDINNKAGQQAIFTLIEKWYTENDAKEN